MIAILDCEMGNLQSVFHGIDIMGYDCEILKSNQLNDDNTHLVLPGVGNYHQRRHWEPRASAGVIAASRWRDAGTRGLPESLFTAPGRLSAIWRSKRHQEPTGISAGLCALHRSPASKGHSAQTHEQALARPI